MPKHPRIPTYRLHKGSGQAVVVLNGKSVYLGVWQTPESRTRYEQVISEWLACGRQSAPPPAGTAAHDPLTVGELILRYFRFAQTYYPPDGDTTSESRSIREALRPVRQLYDPQPAASFGPLALKAVRQAMVDSGWCRSHVNHQINRVRRMFRWAASEELISASVFEALRSVSGLAKGRCGVREGRPVEPAFWVDVEAIKPFCPRPVAAMLDLQYLAAMRSGEVRLMRTMDIEQCLPDCWLYRPGSDQGRHGQHKNSWRGQNRVIVLGPKAIAVLAPWLRLDEPEAYLFQPRQAVEDRNARRRAERVSPRTPSQLARKRKARPKRPPGGHYKSSSYAHAVARACEKAGVKFRPYGLRHGRKMEIESADSTEAARAVLGQKSIQATEHYGTLDLRRATEVITRLG
jgi:integrase